MSSKLIKDLNSIGNIFNDKNDDLESLLASDSKKSKTEVVSYSKMAQFPYIFLGKLIIKFEAFEKSATGMLIGPSVVLTPAKNFVILNDKNCVSVGKKCEFFAGLNCDLELFQGIRSKKVFVPNEYVKGVKSNESSISDKFNFALVFLTQPIGENLLHLFDNKNNPEFKVENNYFYHYFLKNENLNLKDIIKKCDSDKISIVGYKESGLKPQNSLQQDTSLSASNSFSNSLSSQSDSNKITVSLDYVVLSQDSNDKIKYSSENERPFLLENKCKISQNIIEEVKDSENDQKNGEILSEFNINLSQNSIYGNSGPVFMRYKRINNGKKADFVYHFIGFSNSLNKETRGVGMVGETVKNIVHVVESEMKRMKERGSEVIDFVKSDYLHIKLLINNEPQFIGLFKKDLKIDVLFSFSENVMKIPKEYILLKDTISKNDLYNVQNYKFDNSKKIYEIIEDPINSFSASFELTLKTKVYAEYVAGIIIQKFLEINDLDESEVKKHNKKYLKSLFSMIFSEINKFEGMPLIYGKLFKIIRMVILKKLGIDKREK